MSTLRERAFKNIERQLIGLNDEQIEGMLANADEKRLEFLANCTHNELINRPRVEPSFRPGDTVPWTTEAWELSREML